MKLNSRISFSSRCWSSILVASALVLSACSGGGGGGGAVGPGPGPGPNPAPRAAETAVFLTEDGLRLMGAPDDAGATAVPLSGTAMTSIVSFAVSPDGGAVAYIADVEMLDRYELYVREIGAAAPVRVSNLMNSFNDVVDFQWAPDSQSLAYRADGVINDNLDMYRVNRDGSGYYRVFMTGFQNIYIAEEYGWSPDSRYLFMTDRQTVTQFQLRLHDASTGVSGAPSVLFVPPGRQIIDITFSPDSQYIAMRADHLGALGQFEVFRQRVDLSGQLMRSNGTVGSVVKITEYSWSPDSRWLAQKVNHVNNAGIGVNVYDTMNDTSQRVLTTQLFDDVEWSPMTSLLAIEADYDHLVGGVFGKLRLFVFDPATITLEVASDPLMPNESLRPYKSRWSPDGQRIAYVTRFANNEDRVYQAIVGTNQAAVPAIDLPGLDVASYEWSGDSSRFALLALDETQAFHPGAWHIVGLTGRTVFSSATFNTYQTSQDVQFSQDHQRAVYTVDAAAGGPDRLRSVVADGSEDVGLSNLASTGFEYASAILPNP